MLNSPIFSVSPHLSRWVVSQWVVSWWSQSPPAELPFTQSRIISAELLSWVSLCPINSAIIHNTYPSPPALSTFPLVWESTWATIPPLPSLKLLLQWLNLQSTFQVSWRHTQGGFCALWYSQVHLPHELGWSWFNQWYVYQQLLLYTVPHRRNFYLEVLPRMYQANPTRPEPSCHSILCWSHGKVLLYPKQGLRHVTVVFKCIHGPVSVIIFKQTRTGSLNISI